MRVNAQLQICDTRLIAAAARSLRLTRVTLQMIPQSLSLCVVTV